MLASETPNLLIVDDDPGNCWLLAELLQLEGYSTRIAGSGEAALVAVGEAPPDLILLDVMMPGMSGYDVALQLKRDPATATIPVILVTARGDRNARLDGLAAGAEEFITKPVDRAELWLRVRNLLRLKASADLQRDLAVLLERQVLARTRELEQFRTAMDGTADAILLVEPAAMRFVEVNATACQMFAYGRDELFAAGPAALWADAGRPLERVFDDVIHGRGASLVEARMLRSDGQPIDVELHQQALRDGDGWLMLVSVRDITERKRAQSRLYQLAHYDNLTGLPNRLLFHQTLRQALVVAAAEDRQVVVAAIDFDRFKDINDKLGHAAGDQLLSLIAGRLDGCVGTDSGAAVCRLGGDEFAVMRLIDGCDVGDVLLAIRAALRAPFRVEDGELTLTASVGLAQFPDDAVDAQTLLRHADTAMYRAKLAGRDGCVQFTAQMDVDLLARVELEAALRRALDNKEFVLHYQPMIDVATGRIAGLEALLRWERPGVGLVPPSEFVPVLEETGLIVRAGSWVICNACRQIAAWRRELGIEVRVSVNVAGRQLLEGDLEADICAALQEHALPGRLLELELTESSLMDNMHRTIATLDSLRELGLRVAVDDFGTGYSSLAYLRRFPIDKLKIDVAFIRDITRSADDATIALAIIGMAHSLRMAVVAEGVETAQQFAYLREHGCDQIQGYYCSRPLPANDIGPLLIAGLAGQPAS